MRIALLSEVFAGSRLSRLPERLHDCRDRGAELVLLPELPMQEWCPAREQAAEEDAEPWMGPRLRALREAAASVGVALLGGVIVRDDDGTRRNTAVLVNGEGTVLSRYAKVHLPEEPGFWETSHYEPGDTLAQPVAGLELPVGIQICSDIQRPQGAHILAARGSHVILHPRATERRTWERWRMVLCATAVTACTHVLSVNRPGPDGVGIGGPSLAVAPDGRVLAETDQTLCLVTLDASEVPRTREEYPGYLAIRSDLYRDGWSAAVPDKHRDRWPTPGQRQR